MRWAYPLRLTRERDGVNESSTLRPETTVAPRAFSVVVVAVLVASALYALRTSGIFACQAQGYGTGRYLSYCQAVKYGDYDHGAIWFGLEPEANRAAAAADVLFLGNSRLQFGFSGDSTFRWFAGLPAHYYLLGFSHFENHTFEGPLLKRLAPRARAYVINMDAFFEPRETAPGGAVMHDPGAEGRYAQKRLAQSAHRVVCQAVPRLCADEYTIFREREDGAWIVTGGTFKPAPVGYDTTLDTAKVAAYTRTGTEMLAGLPVDRSCVVFTFVPTVRTGIPTARAIAESLGSPFVAPELAGLTTFDGSHLDRPSAERWSAAFLAEADSLIRHCLAPSRTQPRS